MRNLILIVAVAGLLAAPAAARDRRVAITFDDLPFQATPEALCDPQAITTLTDRFLNMLAPLNSRATAFVNEGRMCDDIRAEALPGILNAWLDDGYELGNHTFSHINIHRATPESYLEDLDRGDDITRSVLQARGRDLVWFRHPYLFTGETPEKRAALDAGIAARGYRVAPVTIDNEDWRFGQAYRHAEADGDRPLMERIGAAYVAHMAAVLDVMEPYSADLNGGTEPAQVLLLHANSLNQDWYPAIHTLLLSRGYAFVTLAEAMKEPVYQRPDTWIRANGVSWLHRWALTDGVPFQPEPDTPQWVVDVAEGRPRPPEQESASAHGTLRSRLRFVGEPQSKGEPP
ncbi:MAG: polysaccharide deacetylase family protein [Caulobacterales bacterium]|nr:polysaccharide deacetylase family protein [Caulobacterales bacterium]